MVVVRSKREVSRNALPGVRLTASETATSTGAHLEITKARVGGAASGIGDALGPVVSGVARIVQEQRDYADQVWAISADTQLSKFGQNRLHGQENGALYRMGKDALGIPEEVAADFEKASGEIEKTAKTDRQRAMFLRIKAQHGQDLDTKTQRHVFEQMRVYGVSELESSITTNIAQAITDGLDPSTAGVSITKALSNIDLLGPKLGWGPQQIAEKKAQTQNVAIDGVLTRLITNGKDQEAERWFSEQKKLGNITGKALEKMEEKVGAGTTDGQAERAADLIWKKLGPKDDDDAISIDTMSTEAREMFAGNTKVKDATLAALNHRRNEALGGRKSRQDERGGQLWGAVEKGASLAEIKQMPEYVNASGDEQLAIKRDFQREADHQESKRATRENRLASTESREWTREQREENKREFDHMAETLAYSDPAVLRAMSRDELLTKIPVLGRDNVRYLLGQQETVKKSDAAFKKATVERDVFNEVANAAGLTYVLDSPAKLSNTKKATIVSLRMAMDEELVRRSLKAGAVPSREEMREIAQSVIDAHVTIRGRGILGGDFSMSAGLFSGGVRDLTMADIPTRDRQVIEAKMEAKRDKDGNPVSWTPQHVLDAWVLQQRQ